MSLILLTIGHELSRIIIKGNKFINNYVLST
jgi:hypothetical protein